MGTVKAALDTAVTGHDHVRGPLTGDAVRNDGIDLVGAHIQQRRLCAIELNRRVPPALLLDPEGRSVG